MNSLCVLSSLPHRVETFGNFRYQPCTQDISRGAILKGRMTSPTPRSAYSQEEYGKQRVGYSLYDNLPAGVRTLSSLDFSGIFIFKAYFSDTSSDTGASIAGIRAR